MTKFKEPFDTRVHPVNLSKPQDDLLNWLITNCGSEGATLLKRDIASELETSVAGIMRSINILRNKGLVITESEVGLDDGKIHIKVSLDYITKAIAARDKFNTIFGKLLEPSAEDRGPNIDQCIARLKKYFGYKKDRELAIHLGTTAANLSNYKNGKGRDFPYKWAVTAANKIGKSVDWVLYGKPSLSENKRVLSRIEAVENAIENLETELAVLKELFKN